MVLEIQQHTRWNKGKALQVIENQHVHTFSQYWTMPTNKHTCTVTQLTLQTSWKSHVPWFLANHQGTEKVEAYNLSFIISLPTCEPRCRSWYVYLQISLILGRMLVNISAPMVRILDQAMLFSRNRRTSLRFFFVEDVSVESELVVVFFFFFFFTCCL